MISQQKDTKITFSVDATSQHQLITHNYYLIHKSLLTSIHYQRFFVHNSNAPITSFSSRSSNRLLSFGLLLMTSSSTCHVDYPLAYKNIITSIIIIIIIHLFIASIITFHNATGSVSSGGK